MNELERTLMTISCPDCDEIPKVVGAGRIVHEDGRQVQIMHNGLRVVAGGYYGDWMAQIIRGLRGHHEPQEEAAFYQLLRYARHNTLFVELASFWAYYTLWYLQEVPGSRALCIEPDPNHMKVGRANAGLNGFADRIVFHEAWIGGEAQKADISGRLCESIQQPRALPVMDMDDVIAKAAGPIEVLHIDAQGAELAFIGSMADAVSGGKVRFLVASTHHSSISGSPTTHIDCVKAIAELGGTVLLQHSVQESFSGDGLIVASFLPEDRNLEFPKISRNVPDRSMFPTP